MQPPRVDDRRRLAVGAVALTAVLVISACSSPQSDGERRALDYTERIAIGIADDATGGRTIVGLPPEALAAEMIDGYRTPTGAGVRDDSFSVETLDWGGETSWAVPAFVVLRISADVDEAVQETGGGWFSTGRELLPAGRATACYWITLPVSEAEIGAKVDRGECPDDAEAQMPRPVGSYRLPGDALNRIEQLLASDASLAEATTLFSPAITVDARTIDGMRVIAARGIEPEDCVIVAQRPSGEIERVILTREQVQPGEIGCSADAARLLGPPEGE
ncbi:hypothetical protein [Microcella sp.]|uniref:hypothetical protein n=1 Tax=Microcella sp. TaxID=1913979 RepID=UPI002564388B|nr:hypothetical protein [Microcella sp.]MBX9472591.1 hypothetical protein [Microcella sp.]